MGAEGYINICKVDRIAFKDFQNKINFECYYYTDFLNIDELSVVISYYGENSYYDEWGDLNKCIRLYERINDVIKTDPTLEEISLTKFVESDPCYYNSDYDIWEFVNKNKDVKLIDFVTLVKRTFDLNSFNNYEIWT